MKNFDIDIMENKFKINKCDKCVYVKNTENGNVILCLYVDDMLIIGNNDKIIKSTKDMLNSRFDMKELSLTDVILGIKILKNIEWIFLCQSYCVDKMLEQFIKDKFGVARTPINTSQHLSTNKGESILQVEYSRVIGESYVLDELYKTKHSLHS